MVQSLNAGDENWMGMMRIPRNLKCYELQCLPMQHLSVEWVDKLKKSDLQEAMNKSILVFAEGQWAPASSVGFLPG